MDRGVDTEKSSRQRLRVGGDLSAAIVLLSDGQGTFGFPAIKAAQIAAAHGIRVYTVGVGTPYGGIAHIEGWPPIHAEFEEEMLKEIADVTHGEYFHASNAGKLQKIYQKLSRRLVLERRESEVTALFTAVAAVLTLTGAALSVWWWNRPG
jgi:Ca-activated chloride channel family protein